MNKRFLLATAAAVLSVSLAACSDSGDSDDDGSGAGAGTTAGGGGGTTGAGTTGGGGTGGGGTGGGATTAADPSGEPPVPSGAGAPSGDTKAGNYLGDFGFGQGVYTIDGANRLAGLSLAPDGSAVSLFGELGAGDSYSGTLRKYTHDPSVPASAGVFGTGRSVVEEAGPYELNFVPGQTIESTGGEQTANATFASAGQIPPATIQSVAGSWRGENRFTDCASGGGCRLIFDVTFDGAAVAGSTSVQTGDGTETRSNPIAGTVSEYGDVLLLSFNWDNGTVTNRYDGVAFFVSDGGPRRLVFLGETLADTGNPTIASLLSQ